MAELTKNGRPRATRPDGSRYDGDPSVRMRQLQEDGKVGGEYGRLGGRPRNARRVKVEVPEEDVRALVDTADAAEREAGRLLELAGRLRRRAERVRAA